MIKNKKGREDNDFEKIIEKNINRLKLFIYKEILLIRKGYCAKIQINH